MLLLRKISPENGNKITRKSIVEKRKNEKAVSKCNKLRTFIKSVVRKNISGEYQNSLITDDDGKLMISRHSFENLKYNFPNHKQKHNMRITLYHETNTKIT